MTHPESLAGRLRGYAVEGAEWLEIGLESDVQGVVIRGEGVLAWQGGSAEIELHPRHDFAQGLVRLSDGEWKVQATYAGGRLHGTWTAEPERAGKFEIWSENQQETLAARAYSGSAKTGLDWEAYLQGRSTRAFTIEDEEGLWRGGYRDRTGDADEDLHLIFSEGVVRGRGSDKDGEFVIVGSYHPHTNSVYWNKHYFEPHRVFNYQGIYENGKVEGIWAEVGQPDYTGPFRIEPLLDTASSRL
jgi:hypothetical protein